MIIKFWKEAHKKVEIIFIDIIGDNDDKTSNNLFRLFKLAIYITIIVFFINIFFNDFNKMGEWGDFFGGVLNPLLTFLTFMGLLITIILQQKELQQSRKEFKGQKESLENQEFDNKFFQNQGTVYQLKSGDKIRGRKSGDSIPIKIRGLKSGKIRGQYTN